MVDYYLGNDTYLTMSNHYDSKTNQDETSSQGDFQQRNKEWDDIFRGKGHSTATSDLTGGDDADSIQKEASAFFTPIRKHISNEINDQTLNAQELTTYEIQKRIC